MLPDIDSLALFVQAAEMRTLARAAEASHITVPAASRRLSLLEHQFKASLFERHSRGLPLTPAGEHLLKLARDVVAGVHNMRAEMAHYASGRHAVLRIGVLRLAAGRGFTRALALKVRPLSDAWAARHMLLCTHSQPPARTPLGTLLAHLEAAATTEEPVRSAAAPGA